MKIFKYMISGKLRNFRVGYYVKISYKIHEPYNMRSNHFDDKDGVVSYKILEK